MINQGYQGDPVEEGMTENRVNGPNEETVYINYGTEDEMLVTGYKKVAWKNVLVWIGIILTVGFFKLILYWFPHWELKLTHKKVTLRNADKVLITDFYKANYCRYYVKPVIREVAEGSDYFEIPEKGSSAFQKVSEYTYFRCQKDLYLWDDRSETFYANHGLDVNNSSRTFHEQKGLTSKEQKLRRRHYGKNIIFVPQDSILKLFVKQILNPFYVFQVFSVCLWFSDEYYAYATAIVLMSTGGITTAIYQTRKNQFNLRATIQTTDRVLVYRAESQTFEATTSDQLVPGDIIEIPKHGCELHCDAVLISGTAIVNEAMLTGESVPVTKTMMPKHRDDKYDPSEHSRNTLFCGTRVIQSRNYARQNVMAVVLRTGFLTSKGRLVRSIMYPAPVDFKFEQDSYKFIGFLASVAAVGFVYTCVEKAMDGIAAGDIALDALDLITIVIPPALPAAMTIGSIYAQKRLQKKGIYCISPRTINQTGSVDCICFDKTGTLTEDGLDLWGVLPLEDESAETSDFAKHEKEPSRLKNDRQLIHGMSVCHSLTMIENELSGDPLDLKMFESTKWIFEEPTDDSSENFDNLQSTKVRSSHNEDAIEIGIIRQFPFSSNRQCQSVIARELKSPNFTIYCKGSPEKISKIAKPESLPQNFHEILERYTESGYRVIAMSKRDLDPKIKLPKLQRMERDEVEKDVQFLGLIIFENRLKVASKPIIQELQKARLRTIMITGDNVNTALSVAKECEIVRGRVIIAKLSTEGARNSKPLVKFASVDLGPNDSVVSGEKMKKEVTALEIEDSYDIAIDGPTFEVIRREYPKILDRICVKGSVFARMSPEQKEILVEHLQYLGYFVAMCGDGANDCGALKAAHAGISLSDAESSVASPFTSREQNISCIPNLIREGRCALVTSFGLFKYMAAYSMTQFISVMILYNIDSNLSDFEFLYIDLFLITVFAFYFGLTEAYDGPLARHAPMKSLISLAPISSLLLQIASIIAFQVLGLLYTRKQDWFVPFDYENPTYNGTEWQEYYEQSTIKDSEVACWENYAVFSISAFQYIILAYAFSKSHPYRKWIISNLWLTGSLIVLTVFTIYLVLYPSSGQICLATGDHYKWTPLYYVSCEDSCLGEDEISFHKSKWLQSVFELLPPPVTSFRWIIFGFCVVNVIVCVFIEDIVVEFFIFKKLKKLFSGLRSPKKPYEKIQKKLKKFSDTWPPVEAGQPTWPSQNSLNCYSDSSNSNNVRRGTIELEMEPIGTEQLFTSPFQSAVPP